MIASIRNRDTVVPYMYKFILWSIVLFLILSCSQSKNETPVEQQIENIEEKKAGKVAILLFEGVQIIDFTGPFEVLGQAGYQIITVSENLFIETNMGMKVNSDYTFANVPEASIFIIPGGEISTIRQSSETIKWIKQYSEKSDLVMSVCNGALILAETGLLNGLTATTYHDAISDLEREFPEINVVSDQRFTDNGKFITTAGLSSGIDGAMHIVEKQKGKARAQLIALNLEYNWNPEENYVRALLADKHLNRIFEDYDANLNPPLEFINTEGNTDEWEMVFEVTSNTTSLEELKSAMEKLIIQKTDWEKEQNIYPTTSYWRFMSKEKDNWNGFLEVKEISSNPKSFVVKLKIDKSEFVNTKDI